VAREFDDELGQNMETASPLDATAPRLGATGVVHDKAKAGNVNVILFAARFLRQSD